MKYLITGLGNIGEEYKDTRHNIGFKILDVLSGASNISFIDQRYGALAEYRFKGRTLLLLKPSTYMNLSGKAVNYWLQKEDIAIENLLVLTDDLALPLGTLRLRTNGSDAGHNGLKNIIETLGHQNFSRLRFGIGKDFRPGEQVDYVLGNWSEQEKNQLPDRIKLAIEIIHAYTTIGAQRTMNLYNNK